MAYPMTPVQPPAIASATTAGAPSPPSRSTATVTKVLNVQNATLGVGAARRAHRVCEALLLAPGAGDQRRRHGLPLRAAVTGVRAGGLPLGNWHGASFVRSVVLA